MFPSVYALMAEIFIYDTNFILYLILEKTYFIFAFKKCKCQRGCIFKIIVVFYAIFHFSLVVITEEQI